MPTPPVVPLLPLTSGRGLLVISPGVGPQHAESLYRAACSLASTGVRRLLLREPSLDAAQVERLARRLLRSYPQDGLLLHEKCAGARGLAATLGLGLHLSGSADWEAERRRTSCPLGASAHSAAEVERAAAIGLQWAFLSPVFQPASKPLDTRPHLGEAALIQAQRASPSLVLHALGGITPASAHSLLASGVGGICVLGGVWTMRSDGSADANAEAAARYLDAVDRAMRLRGGWGCGARTCTHRLVARQSPLVRLRGGWIRGARTCTRRQLACQSLHASWGQRDVARGKGGAALVSAAELATSECKATRLAVIGGGGWAATSSADVVVPGQAGGRHYHARERRTRTRRLVAREPPRASGGQRDVAGGVGGVVGNLHGGKYQFGPGGAASAVGDEFASMLAEGGSRVGGGAELRADAGWWELNPNLAGEESVPDPEPRWRQVLRPNTAHLAGRIGLSLHAPHTSMPLERSGAPATSEPLEGRDTSLTLEPAGDSTALLPSGSLQGGAAPLPSGSLHGGGGTIAVVRVSNSCRTWEPFIAAVVDGAGARVGSGVRAEPAGGTLAPRGGANNACDASRPYPDWVKVSVVVEPAGGGESPMALFAGAAAERGGGRKEDMPGGLFLVVKTEEEQWTFALVAEGIQQL